MFSKFTFFCLTCDFSWLELLQSSALQYEIHSTKRIFQMTQNGLERPEESLLKVILRLVLVVFSFGVSCVTCSNVLKHNPPFEYFCIVNHFRHRYCLFQHLLCSLTLYAVLWLFNSFSVAQCLFCIAHHSKMVFFSVSKHFMC